MKEVIVGGVLLLSGVAAAAPSHGGEISCPTMLQSTVQSATSVPAGWAARNSSLKHTLNGVRINFGDPKNGTDGAIYDERSVAQGADGVAVETLIWNLAPLHDPYLVCSYFGTDVILVRSLAGLSRCKVVDARERGAARADIRSATCT
jgi:hypothetical protein